MLQAELAKLRSNCMTKQVGAVIVRNVNGLFEITAYFAHQDR